MDESTGEVFMTAWHSNSFMTVGWTESVSSCERVRELFLFEAPHVDGDAPTRLLLQNSFYERRDCRICNSPDKPICRAPASRPTNTIRSNQSSSPYLYPLRNAYRRFRGFYFGVCLKTKYTLHSDRPPSRTLSLESIVCDIRHGVESISRRLRINLRPGSFSFGTGPSVVANRILAIDTRRRITAQSIEATESSEVSSDEAASSSHSAGATSVSTTGTVKRRRNSDTVHDRDTAEHRRKLRNRVSAARANAARRRHIEQTEAELTDLKENKLPQLERRYQELQDENQQLNRRISAQKLTITPNDCIDIDGVFGFPDDNAFL